MRRALDDMVGILMGPLLDRAVREHLRKRRLPILYTIAPIHQPVLRAQGD
jgi:hypothetical protein